MLSANEHGNQDKYDLSTMVTKYQLFVYLADSLFDDEQYKRAEVSEIDVHVLYSGVSSLYRGWNNGKWSLINSAASSY